MELVWISTEDPRYQAERALRNRVLLHPIGQPDGAWEHRDLDARHLVALNEERVVGCTLLLQHSSTKAQLMQMAVDDTSQKSGIGRALVITLLERAKRIGVESVFCHAREPVIGFYARQGFTPVGPRFEEVGIQHQKMTYAFRA